MMAMGGDDVVVNNKACMDKGGKVARRVLAYLRTNACFTCPLLPLAMTSFASIDRILG